MSLKRIHRTWGNGRLIAVFCALGFLMTGVYALYLIIAFPHRNPSVVAVLGHLSPFAFLTIVFMDTPDATTRDYVTLWSIVAILNAGLYGTMGLVFIRLVRVLRRKYSRQ